MVARKDYIKLIKENQDLRPMPLRFRLDLEPLPSELNDEPPEVEKISNQILEKSPVPTVE
jgi:hypothetical protein